MLKDNFIIAIKNLLKQEIESDISQMGDITTYASLYSSAHQNDTGDKVIESYLKSRLGQFTLCGTIFIEEIAKEYGIKSEFFKKDGDKIMPHTVIGKLQGKVQDIFTIERSIVNFLQILSGIATKTSEYVDAVKGTNAKILDTRKTLPMMRLASKYAVKIGGGHNHRTGLYDGIMIKDNHIKASGDITIAIQNANNAKAILKEKALNIEKTTRNTGFNFENGYLIKNQEFLIEVECDTKEQVEQAVKQNIDVILLDNMRGNLLQESVKIIKEANKNSRSDIIIEASGGITLENIAEIANTGVDYISIGAITQNITPADIGLDILDIY